MTPGEPRTRPADLFIPICIPHISLNLLSQIVENVANNIIPVMVASRLEPAMRHDHLTVSRIHILLRPFETKLSVLVRLLEKRVASDVYAPSSRPQGVTYAKRHRIRFLTGLSSRQATRAYILEQQHGIAKLYNVHQQVIGVEDAFRNLVRSISTLDNERVPTLRGLIAKMVGRQVAHETLRDKEDLENEGVDDCIGHWYGDLTIDTRR